LNWVDEHESELRNLDIKKSTRMIFSHIMTLSEPGGSLQTIDESISRANQLNFHWQVDLAFLAITGRIKDQLPSRQNMLDKVRKHLEETRPNDAEDLLRGL